MPFNAHMKFIDGWYRTGDCGGIDENGNIFISGRIDDMLVLGNGELLSPRIIEDIVKRITDVEDVICFQFDSHQFAIVISGVQDSKRFQSIAKKIHGTKFPQNIFIDKVIEYNKKFPLNEFGKIQRFIVYNELFGG